MWWVVSKINCGWTDAPTDIVDVLSFYSHRANNAYRAADKSLARPGRKQATATEDFEFHISYL